FFFSSRSRHTIFSRDWSSDVCSSDLAENTPGLQHGQFGPPQSMPSSCWFSTPSVHDAAVQICPWQSPLAQSACMRHIWPRTHGRSEERRVGKECTSQLVRKFQTQTVK